MDERAQHERTTLRFLEFELDPAGYRLSRDGESLHVERRVFDLIAYLARHRDRVVPRDEILREVWGGVSVTSHVLVQALHAARRVLGENATAPAVLKTIRRAGIQFIAPAVEVPALPDASFFGREAELAALHQSQARAEAGLPQVVLVAGEPGAGKTRLCHEALTPLEAAGARVHWGRCAESEGAPAFWPWTRAARSVDSSTPYPAAPQLEHRLAGDLGPSRFGLFDAITDWWRSAGTDAPVVVVIDDLHRADDASFELFCFLAMEMRPCRFTLIATYRPGAEDLEASRRDRLTELGGRSESTTLLLGGLPATAVTELCRAAQPELSEQGVASVVERSGGNPFFVTQLLTLSETELGRGALPHSVASAVRQRIEALSPLSRELLSAASVLGREFSAAVAAEMCGLDAEALSNALTEAESAGLVAQAGATGSRFVHDLVRESVYQGLSEQGRGRRHLEAARRLLSGSPDETWAEVSYHASRAGSFGDVQLTLEAANHAATESLARFAFEDAIVHLRRYLDAATTRQGVSDEDRADRLLLLGRALLAVGEKQESRRTLREAARLGGWRYLAQAALETAPGIWSLEAGKLDLEATDLLRTALAAIPDDEHALRAMVGSRLAAALVWAPGSIEERRELVAAATEDAGASEDADAALSCDLFGTVALWLPDEATERLARIDRLIRRSVERRDVAAEVIARIFRVTALNQLGRRHQREVEVTQLARRVESNAIPEASWYVPMFRASLAADICDWPLVERHVAEFSFAAAKYQDLNVINSQAGLGLARAYHEDRSADVTDFASLLSQEFPDFLIWKAALALLLAESGRTGEAEDIVRVLVPEFARGPTDNVWLLAAAIVGEATASCRNEGLGRLMIPALAPYAGQMPIGGYGVLSWGSAARVLGRLAACIGDRSAGEEYFGAAIERELTAGCRVWAGYSLLERSSLRSGEESGLDEAWADLARADEIAQGLGVPRLARGVRLQTKLLRS